MLNRDFTKSNKDYFSKNKVTLISIFVFLLIGLIFALSLGFNGNFEMKGYNEFTVSITESQLNNYKNYEKDIQKAVNNKNGNFSTISVFDQGDNTKLVVKYANNLSDEYQMQINIDIAEALEINQSNISSHSHVKATVKATDYVYTALAIILIITIASIFAYARYNGASALAIIISCVLGTLAYLSLASILRLTIGLSYFGMLVALNMLIVYFAILIFEKMHGERWLASRDYATAIQTAVKQSKFQMYFISIAVMIVGVLFILLSQNLIKYVAINILFIPVVVLAVGLYVLPFVWSVFITKCRSRNYKVKATEVEEK